MAKNSIIENVRTIMEEVPASRNNDNQLIYIYWALIDEIDFDDFDDTLEMMKRATPAESITRARRSVNYESIEEDSLLPTDENVLRRRRTLGLAMRSKDERIKRLGRAE
ncbi:hypothetical protein 035JT001_53 [Bacillus phage 035JT001]|nr:hypothetical protein 035JT001_53 [Bacillus phage 035JT001]